jgi:2-C-methyl-D-erythritol 4-phosphate cytidylyltransferase
MQGLDKVWTLLGDRPVVRHSLDRLSPLADRTVLVTRPEMIDQARASLAELLPSLIIVGGGAERQDSVRAGLTYLNEVESIAVHDAARPFASADILTAGLALLESFDGAIPAIEVVDTIKQVDEAGRIVRTLPREHLRAVQTPQVFRSESLRKAHQQEKSTATSTDDAALLEGCGYAVTAFMGSPRNIKITSREDFHYARFLLQFERPAQTKA